VGSATNATGWKAVLLKGLSPYSQSESGFLELALISALDERVFMLR
jgi:hypothetical protein